MLILLNHYWSVTIPQISYFIFVIIFIIELFHPYKKHSTHRRLKLPKDKDQKPPTTKFQMLECRMKWLPYSKVITTTTTTTTTTFPNLTIIVIRTTNEEPRAEWQCRPFSDDRYQLDWTGSWLDPDWIPMKHPFRWWWWPWPRNQRTQQHR